MERVNRLRYPPSQTYFDLLINLSTYLEVAVKGYNIYSERVGLSIGLTILIKRTDREGIPDRYLKDYKQNLSLLPYY